MKRIDPARLKARRLAVGLTVEQLAARTGYDRKTLWRIEAGKSAPKAETLAHLAKALGVEPAELAIDDALHVAPSSERRTAERLSQLVDAELRARPGTSSALTALALESIYAAHALHDGARFTSACAVRKQAALSADEASALGVPPGSTARFSLHVELASGAVLDVTAHAASADVTRALQAARAGGEVTVELRVLVAPREVFAFFGSRGLHAWTLVAEAAR